jgi:hypothetical protein
MSSQRRTESARANGVRSHGPVTESGKQISSQNALRHTLLARCVVVEGESTEGFEETLTEHLDRFQPADGVEFGIVEEMVAAWAIETRLLSDCVDDQRPCDEMGRLAAAFCETRPNRTYQHALKNLLLLQTLKVPNEPNPISEHLSPAPTPPPSPAEPPKETIESEVKIPAAGHLPLADSSANTPDPPPAWGQQKSRLGSGDGTPGMGLDLGG